MTPLPFNRWLEYYEKEDTDESREEYLEYRQDIIDGDGDYKYHLTKE